MILLSCAYSSAAAIFDAIFQVLSNGRGPFGDWPFHQFRHESRFFHSIDRSDVWMVQRMLEARPRAEKGALLDKGFPENRARSLGWELIQVTHVNCPDDLH
jgi:hypothetical protein